MTPHPDYFAGLTLLRDGRNAAAIAALRRVIGDRPNHDGARRNLIRALAAEGDHRAVIQETIDLPRDAPECAELLFLRGSAFNALSRPDDARASLTETVALDPAFAPAWLNLGNAHADLDDLSVAEGHCRHAITLDPLLLEAHVSLGFILTAQGRVAEALRVLEGAVRLAPDNVHAHWNLAVASLLSGDLARGFLEYEWRKRHDLFRRDFINLPGPVWSGDNPAGRTILVHAEQGLGDTIQFARYLPMIVRAGGHPVLACEPSLRSFLSQIDGVRVVSKFEALPAYDAWIDQMSLPLAFGTTLNAIPGADGYLTADAGLIAANRAALPSGPSIGLAWSGNGLHRNDRRRTPPASLFAPLSRGLNAHVVSLVPGQTLPGVAPPPRPLTDYAETAALITALDLTITVDTSVAHVAGALGCPVHLLLPHAPDWRWLLNRDDSPWYGSVRLYRQPSPGVWEPAIAAVLAG